MKRTKIRVFGKSDTAKDKKEIQRLLREIVMKRDKGCILREKRRCGAILGEPGHVFQADHLISRSNSATFADSRLVVCVCKSCHAYKSLGGNLRKREYDEMVREILPPDRVALWDRCERESWKPSKQIWSLHIAALKQELESYSHPH